MRNFFLLLFIFSSFCSFSQHLIKGQVEDDQKIPLEGVRVSLVDSNQEVFSNHEGKFEIESSSNSGELIFYISGFELRHISFEANREVDLGSIQLKKAPTMLDEIVLIGKGVIDLEESRKTPTAVSVVKQEEIQLRNSGNVEFPNILRNTPSAYISDESGGFGDGQLFIRGFDQSNTAFLLNGQPVNGMQNGRLFWSNWNGLTDIVSAVEVQRGLGSSKLAISSAGGTINIITKTTGRNRSGFFRILSGNDSFLEGTFSYDTGMNENGWGFSFLIDYWQAHANYAKGTKGKGQNYFFSVGKELKNHQFNLLLTGAPLIHDQNPSKAMEFYERYGRKYNNQYGYRNGKYLPEQRKFYHKPIINFNWDWEIEKEIEFSTVLYASFGHGGGTQIYGRNLQNIPYSPTENDELLSGAYHPSNGLIDWDYVQDEYNAAIEDKISRGNQGSMLTSTINNNQYYGGVGNFEFKKWKNLDLNAGIDLRYYRDKHFKQLIDKMGLDAREENFAGNPFHTVSKTYKADPWAVLFNYAPEKNRVHYDYSESLNYHGAFGQAEWANNDFSVFIQSAVSNQSYRRVDRGNFEEPKVSKTLNKFGYNIKTGASWNFNRKNTLFANVGKYSRQPFLTNIFTSLDDRTRIENPEISNEEIRGMEAGYKFIGENLKINLNGYYTEWKNRLLTTSGSYDPEGDMIQPQYPEVSFYFSNIAQLHQGIELDFQWDFLENHQLSGYATLGKWEYTGKTPVRIVDESNQQLIEEKTTELKNTKVGQAPQKTTGLMLNSFFLDKRLRTYISWNYYYDFYGFVNVGQAAKSTLNNETYQPEKLNDYSLFNLGGSFNFQLQNQNFQITGNIYNIFNHKYISQKTNSGYYLGNGTTFNISLKYLI